MEHIFNRICLASLFVVMMLHIVVFPSSAAPIEEYTLKAVYIEKFTRFVEWPAASDINNTSKPFIIGIIGDSPYESTLRKIFSNKSIKGKAVRIHQISEMNEIGNCHILLIANVSKERLQKILSIARKYPVLTISDSKSFASNGVLINFFTSRNKLRFEINEKAARESALTFSYLLMQVAKIVNPAEGEKR